MAELLFKEESFKIIGLCMEIHKTLGMGLKEINYKDAMEIEFIENNIPYEREKGFLLNTKKKYYEILTQQISWYMILLF